jgi:hypothetical protein
VHKVHLYVFSLNLLINQEKTHQTMHRRWKTALQSAVQAKNRNTPSPANLPDERAPPISQNSVHLPFVAENRSTGTHPGRTNTMHTSEQTLRTAIGELNCVSVHRPASLEELTALSAARDSINELLRSCVEQLRTDAPLTNSWSVIADALGSSAASNVRQKYGTKRTVPSANANERVLSFWNEFAERFTWDFLPVGFLHALYAQWMSEHFPEDSPLSKETFTRRLIPIATASSKWSHTRSRPGSLMPAEEPLAAQLTDWTHDGSNAAAYGFRRSKTAGTGIR